MEKKGEWLKLIVPASWEGKTTETILKEVWQVPRKLLHQLRMEKGVEVNGEALPWSRAVHQGEVMNIHLFPQEEYGAVPARMSIDVLYEDDHLLIVNKPAGMDTHPADEKQEDSLANAVAFHFKSNGTAAKVRHIHRLDKDTTGAVLFAKHALAGAMLDRMLEQRLIKRTYIALVQGQVQSKSGSITKPIGKDRHHSARRRVSPSGQQAHTDYRVLHYDRAADISAVQLQLQTGRTHQIRVHMSDLGHPLLGDTLYGGKRKNSARQALHAAHLALQHPFTNEQISCVAPFIDQKPLFDERLLDMLTV